MTRVLVTGGAGFIGSNLVDRLLLEGHEVAVIDDLSRGVLEHLHPTRPRLTFAQMDIRDAGVADFIAQTRPEILLHLAAQIDVRRSVDDPMLDASINIMGTINLLEACRHNGVRKFVLTTSGGCIYGDPPLEALPVDETYPGHPHSPYGASKRGVEEYLHTYAALYGLEWTSLALANVFGPRQDPEGEAGVVSIFGSRMLADEPLTIFGDGEQSRDFVFVGDVVDAFVSALTKGSGLRCNIGTGERTTINELFSVLADLTEYRRPASFAAERPGELRHAALDASLAARELSWKPRSSRYEGLAETIAWLRQPTGHSTR